MQTANLTFYLVRWIYRWTVIFKLERCHCEIIPHTVFKLITVKLTLSTTTTNNSLSLRCRGARALTWAPGRRQPPSSSHRERLGRRPGPAKPGPALERSQGEAPLWQLDQCCRLVGEAGRGLSGSQFQQLRDSRASCGLLGRADGVLAFTVATRPTRSPPTLPEWLGGGTHAPLSSHCVPHPRGHVGNRSWALLSPPSIGTISASSHTVWVPMPCV